MKLNLGCGAKRLDGYCNVDKYGAPDVTWDLETFPWPWEDNSVEEIQLIHVLEHLGQQPDIFIGIMKEMYRVCRDGATIKIVVPHPRHDHFIMDPTHVRPVTSNLMSMFSRQLNLRWQEQGASNTPLALYHHVDFEIVAESATLDEPYNSLYRDGKIPLEQLNSMAKTLNNIVTQIEMTLKAIK